MENLSIELAGMRELPQLSAVREDEVTTLRAAHRDLTAVLRALMELPLSITPEEWIALREEAARALGRWLQD